MAPTRSICVILLNTNRQTNGHENNTSLAEVKCTYSVNCNFPIVDSKYGEHSDDTIIQQLFNYNHKDNQNSLFKPIIYAQLDVYITLLITQTLNFFFFSVTSDHCFHV